MSTVDPYGVLGGKRDASPHEMQEAYRRLAKKPHPELHPGHPDAEGRSQEVTAAYDLLSDAERCSDCLLDQVHGLRRTLRDLLPAVYARSAAQRRFAEELKATSSRRSAARVAQPLPRSDSRWVRVT